MVDRENSIEGELRQLTEGISNASSKGIGLGMCEEEHAILAFDLEQRLELAKARLLVPSQNTAKEDSPGEVVSKKLTGKQREMEIRIARRNASDKS